MNKLKSQRGSIYASIVIILAVIACICVYLIVDLFSLVDIPEEYSLIKFLSPSEDIVFQTELSTSENTTLRKRVSDDRNFSVDGYEIELSNSVKNEKQGGTDFENVDIFDDNTNRFYYSQLDNIGKIIYDKLISERENLKSGNYVVNFGKEFNDLLNSDSGDTILNASFQSAMNAILLDNPDMFFVDITKMYLLTHMTTYAFRGTIYEVSIGPNEGSYYLNDDFTQSSIEIADTRLENLKRSVVKNLKGSDLQKVKELHDYLVDNLDYDSNFSSDNIYNIYGALINKKTVCEGYAKAFKYLLDEVNIPNVIVCGVAQNTKGDIENHAWNYVYINGAWYAIDVTWDDPIIVGGGSASEESRYKYYLRGSEYLFRDHEENGNIVKDVYFEYPELNLEDY